MICIGFLAAYADVLGGWVSQCLEPKFVRISDLHGASVRQMTTPFRGRAEGGEALNNIIEHPRRKRRIDQAKAVVVESLRGLRRDDLSSMRQCHFDELITIAVVHELEMPGSGVAALKRALHQTGNTRWGSMWGAPKTGPIKIGKQG